MDKILGGFMLTLATLPLLVVFGAVVSLVIALPVMVLVGNASIASDGTIPSLGYWATFWLSWAVMLLAGGISK